MNGLFVATAPGFAPMARRVVVGAGAVAQVSLRLSAAASLKVRVTDESGAGIAGARVEIEYPAEPEGRMLASIVNRQISVRSDGSNHVSGIVPDIPVRVRAVNGAGHSASTEVNLRSLEERALALTGR